MQRRQPAQRSTRFDLPGIPVAADAVEVLSGPGEFRSVLLERIATARRRIVLVALYLQDDATGRLIMEALYAAYRANPALEIVVLVDRHRAQRGLLGKAKSAGNAAMYREYASRFGDGVKIVGVPVQSRELFGVLHVKGFIIDDTVLYSGASINDVYLMAAGRYRLDRYHVFENSSLADSMAAFVRTLLESPAVSTLNRTASYRSEEQHSAIRTFRRGLRSASYRFEAGLPGPGEVAVTPVVGLGSGNPLNETILALLRSTKRKVVLYTPYFNLPRALRSEISHLLSSGREVTIVVGDKTANDFFIPIDEPLKTSGLLPYLYEGNLRRFARTHRRSIADGRLNIHLWSHEGNSFHLKGVLVDDRFALLTGSNLNPRSWKLDLENGLVIRDPHGLLVRSHEEELGAILKYARRLTGNHDLETPAAYPKRVERAMKLLGRARLDRLLNRLL